MADYERKDDSITARIEQKLEDFVASQSLWNRTHDEKGEAWRKSIEDRFIPLEDFIKQAGFSYKLLLGLGAAIGTSYKLYSFIHEHWK